MTASQERPRGSIRRFSAATDFRRLAASSLAGLGALMLAGAAPPPLAFRIDEGHNINAFVKDDGVAAHLVARSGAHPRLLVAFPAGNSGVGLWLSGTRPIRWVLNGPVTAVAGIDAKGRPLRGISAELTADSDALHIDHVALSSVRVLRDWQSSGLDTPEVASTPQIDGNQIVWQRDRLDGTPGYRLAIRVEGGQVHPDGLTGSAGRLRIRITALTGETPLTPLPSDRLLTAQAGTDQRAREVLSFLAYREKFLAGSWRFDTYFGRDTLITTRLLMPVLEPEAVESALGSVLARLSPDGEVAHEETIGDYAALQHLRAGEGATAKPVYDYKMVDGGVLLPAVAAAWLLDDPRGRSRAAAFLATRAPSGQTYGALLASNLQHVMSETERFAHDPRATNLIAIHPGVQVGNWRDSDAGLAGGRFPYDVNAILAPAALRAAAAFARSGLLADQAGAKGLDGAAARAAFWSAHVPALFTVTVAPATARARVAAFGRSLGVPAHAESLGTAGLRFDALSLDGEGRPVPVMHSDGGYALLFADPDPATLARIVTPMLRPFPAGLMTEAGLLVANPSFASNTLQQSLNRGAYHGTVVWSWQQAMWIAGLDRQLRRHDLSPALRKTLVAARSALWKAVMATAPYRTSELWSWSYANGHYRPEAFGSRGGDEDESNAAQLWSTVFLALTPHGPEQRR